MLCGKRDYRRAGQFSASFLPFLYTLQATKSSLLLVWIHKACYRCKCQVVLRWQCYFHLHELFTRLTGADLPCVVCVFESFLLSLSFPNHKQQAKETRVPFMIWNTLPVFCFLKFGSIAVVEEIKFEMSATAERFPNFSFCDVWRGVWNFPATS